MSDGLVSGSQSAAIAADTTMPIQVTVSHNTRRPRRAEVTATRSTSTSSAAMADSRIEDAIEDVDNEIDQHERRCDEQHHALHDHKVASVDRADQQPADPRQGKDRLDQYRTTDQPSDIDAGHRHQSQRGRLQR